MSTFTIPNDRGQIRQVNSGDLFGELNETFNIDLTTSEGKIKVSKKLTPVLVEGVDITTPAGYVDMLVWDGHYYVLTEDEGYRCSVSDDPTNSANWSESITGSHDADLSSTAVIFDGQMRISLDTNIARWNGSASYSATWWTSDVSGTALRTGVPHVMEVVQSGKETLYITDGSRIQYLEKGGTPKVLELDSNVTASCLASGLSGAMWAGTYSETTGNAYVYEMYTGEVVGSTPVYRQAYPINAQAVLGIWMKDNSPHIVTDKGEIQAFNGAGFTTIAEFPFKFSGRATQGVVSGLIQDSNRSRAIHPRGVRVHEDSVYLNINTKPEIGDSNFPLDTRSHSGVWEYNYKTQVLNHRFAFAHTDDDYGALIQNFAYPILIVDNDYTFLMAGGTDNSTGFSTLDNLYMTTTDAPQGWFITPEISSGSVADTYESLYHKAKTMAVGQEIFTLYRTTKRDTIKEQVNWTSETECTSLGDFLTAEVGDAIRVVQGKSAGDFANIVSLSKSTNTWTITVDRPIGSVGVASRVYCDNFKKDAGTYTSVDGEFKRLGGYGTNPWIQFMVILKGDIEYRQFISKGNSKGEL